MFWRSVLVYVNSVWSPLMLNARIFSCLSLNIRLFCSLSYCKRVLICWRSSLIWSLISIYFLMIWSSCCKTETRSSASNVWIGSKSIRLNRLDELPRLLLAAFRYYVDTFEEFNRNLASFSFLSLNLRSCSSKRWSRSLLSLVIVVKT